MNLDPILGVWPPVLTPPKTAPSEPEQYVLCTPAENVTFHGFLACDEEDLSSILDDAVFQPRSKVEDEPRWKQIIPYVMLTYPYHNPTIALSYWRSPKGAEGRLHGKRSTGFGGHIDREILDLPRREPNLYRLLWAAGRELQEEAGLDPRYSAGALQCRGMIYAGNGVGEVHVGVAFTLPLRSLQDVAFPDASVVSPEWMTFDSLYTEYFAELERWSQVYLAHLLGREESR